MCSAKATHSAKGDCTSAEACLCSNECNWGRVFTEIYKYSPSSQRQALWLFINPIQLNVPNAASQSQTITQMQGMIRNFFSPSAPAPCRKLNMILITNKTIAASEMERRRWLHNQVLWVHRQLCYCE